MNTNSLLEELRLSQARCRGFESHHPLHKAKRQLALVSRFEGLTILPIVGLVNTPKYKGFFFCTENSLFNTPLEGAIN
jgi:hypothetical protein